MNIFYFYSLNDIGGVESFLYYIAKKYNRYDITIYYSDEESSKQQIKRLKKYVRVKKYNGEKIKCDVAFWNYQPFIINNVDAKEHIQVIHYNAMKQPSLFKKHDKITKYVAVSKDSAKSFKELTGIECDYAYIPIEYDFEKKALIITCAMRIDKMKGTERLIRLSKELEKQKVPYIILVFTNNHSKYLGKNIIYMHPKMNIAEYIKISDYFFCASDYEALGLSKIEALCLGIPIIRTPLKVDEELGINDNNSIMLEFDCSNIEDVVKKMISTEWNFKYKPPKDKWEKYLSKKQSTYRQKLVKIKCITTYWDYEELRYIEENEILEVDEERAKYLVEERKLCEYAI